jgi:hypothetical protein
VAQVTPAPKLELTLPDLRERVLQRNETLQGRLLTFEAQRRRARGEYGVFEPDFFGSYTHEVNNRQNTAEQQASLLGAPTFSETNNNYESGLESLVPSGARVRLGYTLRDLRNTLEPVQGVTNGQYQSFLGVTVVQPLLKNFGTAATMAGIRMAAISNKMAFQEYRRDLMTLISGAVTETHRPPMGREDQRARLGQARAATAAEAIAAVVEQALETVPCAAVFVPTRTGATARMISRFNPPVWIAALSPDRAVCQGLAFCYGVQPIELADEPEDWRDFAQVWLRQHNVQGAFAMLVAGPSVHHPEANHRIEFMRVGTVPTAPPVQ